MTVRELTTKIGFKVDEQGLKNADNKVKKAASNAKQMLGKVAVTLGAAFSVKKIADSVVKTAMLGDEAAKTSRRIGITAETLQELRFAADRQGVSAGTLSTSMDILQKQLGQLKIGSGALASYLKQSGDKNLENQLRSAKGVEESFTILADKMQSIKDPSERAAFATAAFGRSGIDMIKMLENGSVGVAQLREEARKLGGVVSNETAAQSELFIDSLTNMKFALKGIGIAIGSALMPAAKTLIDMLTRVMKPILDALVPIFAALNDVLNPIVEIIEAILTPALEILKPILLIVAEVMKVIGSILTALIPLFQAIGKLFSFVGKVLMVVFKVLKPFFDLISKLAEILGQALNPLFEVLGGIFESLAVILKPLNPLFEVLATVLGALGKAVEWVVSKVKWAIAALNPEEGTKMAIQDAMKTRMQEIVDKHGVDELRKRLQDKLGSQKAEKLLQEYGYSAKDTLEKSVINDNKRQMNINMNNNIALNGAGGATGSNMQQVAQSAFTIELKKLLRNSGY